jgi:hypothetical protein
MNTSDIVGLTDQMDEIRSRYPKYGHHPEMVREMAALWGDPPHYEHGVMDSTERVNFELDGHKQTKAEIRLALTPNGRYAMSTSYDYPNGGAGSAPGVGDHKAYLSREAAIEAGVDELIKGFTSVRDWKGTRPHTEPLVAQKMIDHLETLKGGSCPMALFEGRTP